MSIIKKLRRLAANFVFGSMRVPLRFFLGLQSPQTEVSVWLYGMDTPQDVTFHHSMACAAPFTVCIAFDKDRMPSEKERSRLSLKLREHDGRKRVLGELRLKYAAASSTSGPELMFFEVTSAKNYCLPRLRLWAHRLRAAYSIWRGGGDQSFNFKMTPLDHRAMEVIFICPRPIMLVSVLEESGGNMFPMNVMGQIDDSYFAFSLKGSKFPAHLVERVGRVALSSIPMPQADVAYRLGPNHGTKSIHWHDLPFATKPSTAFRVPVPIFSLRVREMEVEIIRKLGSHTFFAARIVHDELFAEGQEWAVAHGHYAAWRYKKHNTELVSLLIENARIKGDGPSDRLPI